MLPSSTVENYLKAIFHAQTAAGRPDALVPMGQLAGALGVVPGTATAMVRTLAESGLVTWEPYSGVRLTPAGERLAAMVLRRHRLIELFLVQVMGMSWAEVHEEAEQLEHAVSDRLIDRIDEMLGRPAVDPHGDPIPDPEGTLAEPRRVTLLDCPVGTPVTVTRVIDQDAGFLRFIESSDLKPGRRIEVEARDAAADSVRVRAGRDRHITLGMRAASKLLVEVASTVVAVLVSAVVAFGQEPAATGSERPFEILDNSFLVEEAFNQEAGIFQNIMTFYYDEPSSWEALFTQEWPVGGQRHQFSYSVPISDGGRGAGIGDLFLHYRYQALDGSTGAPAFAPRLSVLIPSGSEEEDRGSGVVGWHVNLPFSKQHRDLFFHWNGGFTIQPGVETPAGTEETLFTPLLSGSLIWRTRPMLNLLVEATAAFVERVEGASTLRETVFTLSPGARGGWNLGAHQLILGIAIPVTMADDDTDAGVFGYFSYEMPFR
jgi:DtxR family Mn-dependent transcriptional regulator